MEQMPLTAVLYGQSGSGKSSLAATCPGPVLVIDSESAGHFIHRVKPNGDIELPDVVRWEVGDPIPSNVKDICVITVSHWKEVVEIEEQLRVDHPFRSIVVDSVTELQQRLFTNIAQSKGREVLAQQDWGLARNRFGVFLRSIRDMAAKDADNPIQVCLFLALPFTSQEGATGPNLQGSVRTDLPGLVDLVGYVKLDVDPETGEEYQKMLISNSVPGILAKCRSPHIRMAWDSVIESPNIDEIWKSVQPKEKK